jgi:AcrR family transcriptional regulator
MTATPIHEEPEGNANGSEMEERILAAARNAVKRYGLLKTSMGDVATLGGVSRGTVYKYFPTKSALTDAILNDRLASFLATVGAEMDGLVGFVERINRYIAATRETGKQVAARRDQNLFASHEDELMALAHRPALVMNRIVEFLSRYVEDAMATGEIDANLSVTATAEWVGRICVGFSVALDSDIVDLDDPSAMRAYLEGYLMPGLRPRPTGAGQRRRAGAPTRGAGRAAAKRRA